MLTLAEQCFTPLSDAEEELFRAAHEGGEASALAKDERENNPLKAAKWDANRVVRAECITWICTDPLASTLVSYQGLDLRGMRVDGDLDLTKAEIKFSLSAQRCAFSGSVVLRDTQVRALSLTSCYIKNVCSRRGETRAIDAEGAKIAESLFLKDCQVKGEVSLVSAKIGRDLDFSGCNFSNEEGDALNADGAKIEGDILFGNCKAEGSISLLGIAVGGSLDCATAQFHNPESDAFRADGAKIEGDFLFGDGAKAEGSVSLSETAVGGNFDCGQATFLNPSLIALNANGAKIEGDVLFQKGFKAEGEVSFLGADIRGDFDCSGARFSNAEADALTADGLMIEGNVTLEDGFNAVGQVRFLGAEIEGNLYCNGAQFINPQSGVPSDDPARDQGDAFAADGAKIEGDVTFEKVSVNGLVTLAGTKIGGNLNCFESKFSNPTDTAFSADSAKIEGTLFIQKGSEVEGEVLLTGVAIGGDLDCGQAQLSKSKDHALSANRAKIGGNVYLSDGLIVKGEVSMLGAVIGGNLECANASFINPGGKAVNADGAKIEGSVIWHKNHEILGWLNIANSEVGRQLDLRGFTASHQASIDLRSTKVSTVTDIKTNWLPTSKALLDGFSYERFHVEGTLTVADWIRWLHRDGQQRKTFWHRLYGRIIAMPLNTRRWLVRAARRMKSLPEKDEVQARRFTPQPYEQLAAVLRKMGHERDARHVMIEKNLDRARSTRVFRQGWWWYNCFGRLIGYGYEPWRAFAGSVALVLFGTFLFQVGAEHGLMSPAKESAYVKKNGALIIVDTQVNEERKLSEEYPPFNEFVYSLESFTPLLKLDQSANWTPNSNRDAFQIGPYTFPLSGGFLRYYLYFHIVMGWLLTSLWVGAVTGLVKS